MRSDVINRAINFINHPDTQDVPIPWKLTLLEKKWSMTKKELDSARDQAYTSNMIAAHLGQHIEHTDWRIGWNEPSIPS